MITCQICSREFSAINKRHLASHNISREEYIAKFPKAPLQSAQSIEKRRLASFAREASLSAEVRAQRSANISKSMTGKSSWNSGKGGYTLEWSDEARQRIVDRGAWNRGIPVTEEQKQKQAAVMIEGYSSGRIIPWNIGNVIPAEVRQKISDSCKRYVMTPEQRENHLRAIRIYVASPGYVNGMVGKKHTEESKARMAAACKLSAGKLRASMEAAGHWIPLADLPEVIKYRREVHRRTNQNAHLIPGYDAAKRGRCSLSSDNWQIDHKLSICQGWLDDISPEVISHEANLQFIPWRENLAKWHRSCLTKEELMGKIAMSTDL